MDLRIYSIKTNIYQKLYTKTAAKGAVLLPVMSSSDDDPGFRHGFGAEASLPLTQDAPAVSHNITIVIMYLDTEFDVLFNLYDAQRQTYFW